MAALVVLGKLVHVELDPGDSWIYFHKAGAVLDGVAVGVQICGVIFQFSPSAASIHRRHFELPSPRSIPIRIPGAGNEMKSRILRYAAGPLPELPALASL